MIDGIATAIAKMSFCFILGLGVLLPIACIAGDEGIHSSNPYNVLGVKNDASDAEVSEAFRNLSKKYHPDSISSAHRDEETYKLISNAYKNIKENRSRQLLASEQADFLKRYPFLNMLVLFGGDEKISEYITFEKILTEQAESLTPEQFLNLVARSEVRFRMMLIFCSKAATHPNCRNFLNETISATSESPSLRNLIWTEYFRGTDMSLVKNHIQQFISSRSKLQGDVDVQSLILSLPGEDLVEMKSFILERAKMGDIDVLESAASSLVKRAETTAQYDLLLELSAYHPHACTSHIYLIRAWKNQFLMSQPGFSDTLIRELDLSIVADRGVGPMWSSMEGSLGIETTVEIFNKLISRHDKDFLSLLVNYVPGDRWGATPSPQLAQVQETARHKLGVSCDGFLSYK